MRLTRPSHLLAVAVAVGALAWVASSVLDPGGTSLRLTWWVPVGLLAVAAAVAAAGWPVRRLTRAVGRESGLRDSGPRSSHASLEPAPVPSGVRGVRPSDRHRVDPQRATQVLALARAAAFLGAGLAGAYLAVALLTAPTAVVDPRVQRLVLAVAATAASVAVSVCGVVVERWCRLPDDGRPGRS